MKKIYKGGTRVITRFLFIPRIIGWELRWLVITKIEQQLIKNSHGNYKWEDINWKN